MAGQPSPIWELAEFATPLFGHPDRPVHHVATWDDYRRIPSGVAFTVATEEGERLPLALTFVTPWIVRLRFAAGPDLPDGDTPMLVTNAWPEVPVTVRREEDALWIESGGLRLRCARLPWQLSVHTPDGRTLYRQEVGDRAFPVHVAYPLGYSVLPDGRRLVHETAALDVDEHLFGLGQQYGPLDKRGRRIAGWTREARGTNTAGVTYINVPFFWSTHGYGVFVNQPERTIYELGYPSTVSAAFQVDGPALDYFIIAGPEPKTILARYTDLTGKPPVPPLWSFGVWFSRCMYRDRAQVEGIVERLRSLEIPFDVIHLDPLWLKHRRAHRYDACDFVWDDEAFPDPAGFIAWLRQRGARLSLWENPYVWRDTEAYRQGVSRGWFARTPDGDPAPALDNPDEAVVLDYTSLDALDWVRQQHRRLLDLGVAAFKTDYGEGVPYDAVFADGRTGREVHNVYPLLYNRAVFQVTQEARGPGEAVVFGRSGYAGSQRYPIHWTGDAQSTWHGMAGALRGGLSNSLSGLAFWSHDIGGFYNPEQLAPPDPTVYIRWAQWGLLSSHARFHGVRGREPWYYGDEAVRIVRRFARLRYRLLPYIWRFAHEAAATGLPVVRPLVLEFPDDPHTAHEDLEFLLGTDILVAPVFNHQGERRVYLPPAVWYDYWTGRRIQGPAHHTVSVPLDRIPLYVRGDSVIPLAPEMAHTGERRWDPLTLVARVERAAACTLPTDWGPVVASVSRDADEAFLELSGPSTGYTLRLLQPERPAALEAEGPVEGLAWEWTDGWLTASFRLGGPTATLTVRASVP